MMRSHLLKKSLSDEVKLQEDNHIWCDSQIDNLKVRRDEFFEALRSLNEKVKVLEISVDALKKSTPLKKIVPEKKKVKK